MTTYKYKGLSEDGVKVSGVIQAFVFSLLTMIYIAGACPPPETAEESGSAV